MERKIGEIFEYNGEWYQCVEGHCAYCSIQDEACEQRIINGVCRLNRIFKKLEKIGEPYINKGRTYQLYGLPMNIEKLPPHTEGITLVRFDIVEIENKEDMEEKKLNLKPFDIQKAREGKPVCTRDGRKVRIICFDRKDARPIVALIKSDNGDEGVYYYYADGLNLNNYPSVFDLMMLPEKKEGWVNVYKERIYSTKEEAIEATYDGVTYVDTVKVCWEE